MFHKYFLEWKMVYLKGKTYITMAVLVAFSSYMWLWILCFVVCEWSGKSDWGGKKPPQKNPQKQRIWFNIGTGCSEQFWNLHPWVCWEPIWWQPWATCSSSNTSASLCSSLAQLACTYTEAHQPLCNVCASQRAEHNLLLSCRGDPLHTDDCISYVESDAWFSDI